MRNRASITLFLFLSGVAQFSVGQAPMSDEMSAYRNLLNGDTSREIALHSPFASYLEGYRLFLNTTLHGGDAVYDTYTGRLASLEESLDPESPWHDYIITEWKLQEAFIELKAGNELSAAWKLRQAFKMAQSALEKDDANPALHKTIGVMKCLIGAVPENMQWLPSLFGISGSIDEGVAHLERACREAPWICQESNLLLALCHSYLLSDDAKAISYAKTVFHSPAKHPLPAYLLMNIYQRAHLTRMSMDLYDGLTHKQRDALPQLHYLAGNGFMQAGEYEASINAYRKFLEKRTSDDFVRDAWYKTALSWWLQGQRENAEQAMANALATGEENTEADRYATIHAKKSLPDRYILKVRLLTDGGYYQQASELISTLSEDHYSSIEDRTEFVYRKARLMHLQGDTTGALSNYAQVIRLQGDNPWYFAPNSCLMSGYLIAGSDRIKAREYFQKVGEYHGYEYEKGIERKAQAALSHYQ